MNNNGRTERRNSYMRTFAAVEPVGFNPMRRTVQTPAVGAPEIKRRNSEKKKLWVFLLPKIWEELSYAARFATRVFDNTNKKETVSRNDFIEDSLLWALAAYWKDKGGRPSNEAEFEQRAKAYGDKLKAKEEAASESAGSTGSLSH